MIKSYAKLGEVEKAQKILEDSKEMISTTYVLNTLLEALVKKGMLEAATRILEEHMIQSQVVDSTTFGTLGRALISQGQFDKINQYILTVIARGTDTSNEVFNTWLETCVKNKQLEHAFTLLEKFG